MQVEAVIIQLCVEGAYVGVHEIWAYDKPQGVFANVKAQPFCQVGGRAVILELCVPVMAEIFCQGFEFL